MAVAVPQPWLPPFHRQDLHIAIIVPPHTAVHTRAHSCTRVHTCQSHHHTFRCLIPSHRNLPLTPPQIIEKDPLHPSGPPQTSLVEIGPRFVLTPIRIFEGSFGGPTLFANPEFISPAAVRASVKREAGQKYRVRKEGEMDRDERRKRTREDVPEDQLARKKVFA